MSTSEIEAKYAAEEMACSPMEAMMRMMDELAAEQQAIAKLNFGDGR